MICLLLLLQSTIIHVNSLDRSAVTVCETYDVMENFQSLLEKVMLDADVDAIDDDKGTHQDDQNDADIRQPRHEFTDNPIYKVSLYIIAKLQRPWCCRLVILVRAGTGKRATM